MKNFRFPALLALLLFISFNGCQKDKQENDAAYYTSQDLTSTEDLLDEAQLDVDDALENRGDPNGSVCPTSTWAHPIGVFPNTLTIDFGQDGCIGRYGRIRKGKIVVDVNKAWIEIGSQRLLHFEDFSINGVAFEGTATGSFTGLNSALQPVLN
ncbi:MAG: hypothetical protein ABIV51_09290 [Saprospiraceae bacterium]